MKIACADATVTFESEKFPENNEIDKTRLQLLDCDISHEKINSKTREVFNPGNASSTPLRQRLSTDHSLRTPITTKMLRLEKELCMANEKIKSLENSHPKIAPESSSNVSVTPKSARIQKLAIDLSAAGEMTNKLREQNILLRHKYLDISEKIRTVCRIKPNSSSECECFEWSCSDDGVQIS